MMFPCVPCGRDVELAEKGLTDCLRNLTLERIVERCKINTGIYTSPGPPPSNSDLETFFDSYIKNKVFFSESIKKISASLVIRNI